MTNSIHAVNPNSYDGLFSDAGLILFCKHCETEKKDHLDDGTCLFAPMKFEAMSAEAYIAFLTRSLASSEALPNIVNIAPVAPFGAVYPSLYPGGTDSGFVTQTIGSITY